MYVRLWSFYFTHFLSGEVVQKRLLWTWAWSRCLRPTWGHVSVTFKTNFTISGQVTFKTNSTISRQVTFKTNSTITFYSIISRRGRHRVANLLWWWKVAANWIQRRSLEVPILWPLDNPDQATSENSPRRNSWLDSRWQLLQWSFCYEEKETWEKEGEKEGSWSQEEGDFCKSWCEEGNWCQEERV